MARMVSQLLELGSLDHLVVCHGLNVVEKIERNGATSPGS